MAFGKDDTEKLYENLIYPVLKENNIKAVIINRQEKNEDLNIQIIDQLIKCDFAIVDLTYARPSVYYEAGFSERLSQVIYTVRHDHLDISSPDNLRVHFDLSVKPIISWKNPNDEVFAKKLSSRLKATVIKAWKEKNNIREADNSSKLTFNLLNSLQKVLFTRKIALRKFKKIGFSKWALIKDYRRANIKYKKDAIINGAINDIKSVRMINQTYSIITLNSTTTLYKEDLRIFKISHSPGSILTYENGKELLASKEISKLSIHHFILSIRKISLARIEDIFPEFTRLPNSHLFFSSIYYPESGGNEGIKKNCLIYLHFIDGIESELSLSDVLQKHIDLSGLGKNNSKEKIR